ncbi:MAG TPA: tetratricopeptide repeat protein [Terriglobia bacterium]|nr:tetratricopeptide repeat protein [Terriglobia bacterium]
MTRLLHDEVSEEETALLNLAEATLSEHAPVPLRTQPLRRHQIWWSRPVWKFAAVAASLVLILGASWMFLFNPSLEPNSASLPPRTLEARISGEPYSEFLRTRTGATAETGKVSPEALNRLGADRHEAGKFCLEQNDIGDALIQLEAAEQTGPDSPEIRNDLGVAYMESAAEGNLEKAAREFQRALELNPRYEPARFNLVLAYEREGDFSQARQQMEEYLRLDSKSSWAKEVQAKLQLLKR